uniref:Glutathione S-transferase n=2 Tax=Rhabditophanes sp. KR3021 TaxID=114890 RepID=A0AC35TVR9_9BILA
MSKLMKLYYFDTEGKAEVLRLIFKFANVKFEDIRISKEDWPAIKNDSKFLTQQLPVLELENGTILSESKAIVFYLGKLYGFMGKDLFEDSKILQYILGLEDSTEGGKAVVMEQDPVKKAELGKAFFANVVKQLLDNYTKFLHENGGNGHLVGEKVTVADIFLYQTLRFGITTMNLPIEQGFPVLNHFYSSMKEKVEKLSHA